MKNTGITTNKIFDLIKDLLVKSGIGVKAEMWDSYDVMNNIIKNSMF